MTSAGPPFDLTPLKAECWRFVEDQNKSSTMKLVDSADEPRVLEELLDSSKPPVPQGCAHLHYLFFTPFRYVARRDTRYRRAGDPRGVYYCAESVRTAAAEMAFYKVLFFLESPATPVPRDPFELTAFSTVVSSKVALDVQRMDAEAVARLSDPVDYAPCHAVAERVRERGGEIIRFPSVRDPAGMNLAVLSCATFRDTRPRALQGWWFSVRADRVFARRQFGEGEFEFLFEDFAGDPRIAAALG